MKTIIGKRRSGKTTELIKLASETGGYIVCRDMDECSRIQSIAKEKGYSISFPITYSEFAKRQYHSKGIKCFLIDNVELLLSYMSDVPIHAITLNQTR